MGESLKQYFAAFGKWGFVLAAIVIGDVVGIIGSYFSNWLLPQWAWWLILVGILVLSPIIAFHKLRLDRDMVRQTLRDIENSRPNLVWFENHGHALYAKKPHESTKPENYTYHVLQVWFLNQPLIASEASVAENVTATVEFYNRTDKSIRRFPGCFIIAEALDYAGNTGENEEVIDKWPPNDEPHKLQVAIKRQENDRAYVYGKGTDVGAKPIEKGEYYVSVELKGTRVIRLTPFWFAMSNLGIGHELTLSKPINRPNLRKEGFQTE